MLGLKIVLKKILDLELLCKADRRESWTKFPDKLTELLFMQIQFPMAYLIFDALCSTILRGTNTGHAAEYAVHMSS